MTTPSAGSIGIGLHIDGSDLSSKITEAVMRHLRPVLEDIQHQLDKVQRGYRDTARTGQRSGTEQVVAAEGVVRAVGEVADEQRKTTAATVLGTRQQTRALNAVTRAVERQAAAYTALAAARTAAASAPNPAPPPSGGGVGGGGPPSGGGGGGSRGFGGRGGGVGRRMIVPALANAGALILGSFPTAALAVTNLTGAIQQLGQAGLVLPGIIGGIVTSVGALKLGMGNLGDAITDAREAIKAEDWEALNDVLKDMPESAQQLVRVIAGPLADAGENLRNIFQTNALDGTADQLQALANRYMPMAERAATSLGKVWNTTFDELIRVADKDSTRGFLDQIIGNTGEAQTRLNKAIEPLVNAFGKLTAESSDFLPRLADGITALANRFSNWVDKIVANGDLDRWIEQGLAAATNLGNALLNIANIIGSLTKAAGGDGGFLKWLDDATGRLATFLSSDKGQDTLVSFFKDAREQMALWGDVLRQLGPLLLDVYNASKQWTEFLLPIIEKIFAALNAMPGGIEGITTAFLAWTSLRGVTALATALFGIGRNLDDLPGRATRAGGGISAALSRIAVPAALGALLAGQTGPMQDPSASAASKLGGLGLNVGGGAALGAMAGGPWGAAIGALIGAGLTLFQSAKAQLDKGRAEWEAEWQRDHDAGPNRPGSREQQLAAVPALRGQQLPSLYNPNGTLKPTIGQDMAAKIAAGQLPGWTIGPDGTIMGPNGVTIPGIKNTPMLPSQLNPNVVPPNLPQPATPKPMGPFINEGQPQFPQTAKAVEDIATKIEQLPEGEVRIKDPSPEVIQNLEKVDAKIEQVSENEIVVKANTDEAKTKLDALIREYQRQTINIRLNPVAGPMPPAAPRPPGGAGGGLVPFSGMLPGYSPGIDNLLGMVGSKVFGLSGGEGIIIPEAMRAIGPRALYNLNARFRPGLSRTGYADGGVVGGVDLGGDPSVIGLLTQIRDALVGKVTGPLSQTAAGVDELSSGLGGGSGSTDARPFGGDFGKYLAADFINSFGGDSRTLFPEFDRQGNRVGGTSGGVLAAADYTGIADALAKFATTGNTADLAGSGLGINDSVVSAIVSARNKKKGGLSDEEIAALVTQVIGGGGYSGVLTDQNSSLIKSLTSYRNRMLQSGTSASTGRGLDPAALGLGMPLTGAMDPISAYAARYSGGQYQFGASDLAKGLSDCSGAVSDLVELITQGQATGARLFSTADAGSVLKSLGAVEGAIPGALQIGWDAGHMRATLPNGVNFESGGQTGQGATYGGNARGAAGMDNIMSLPVGMSRAMTDAMGGVASDMCGCVSNAMPDLAQQGLSALVGGAGDALNAVVPGLLDSGLQALAGPGAPTGKTVEGPGDTAASRLANLLGFKVSDLTRQGGDGGELMRQGGIDATGRVYSDAAVLVDRTFTSLETANKARHQQLMDVMNQVRELLTSKVLGPTLQSATQAGISGISSTVQAGIGANFGAAAAPPIASAVRAAIPMAPTHDSGGDWPTNTYGLNRTGGTEYVLTPPEAALFKAGKLGGWNLQPEQQHLAGNANATVGAEFFGVSQVPIIADIINFIVQLLLTVIGVNIEMRKTMFDMTSEIRGFRGDVQAFDATGRIFADSAALTARSQTSRQIQEQQRMRVLRDVIIGALRFVIEKIIIPLIQTAIQAAINFGTQAISGAIGGAASFFAPGSGGIASGLANAAVGAIGQVASQAGQIAVEIIGQIASTAIYQLIEVIGDLLLGLFPNLLNTIAGGFTGIGQLLTGIFTGVLQPFVDIGRAIGGFFGGIFGGILPSFDKGGEAVGMGLMPKAILAPERTLDPSNTRSFNTLVDMLRDGTIKLNGQQSERNVTMYASFPIAGGREAGQNAHARLLELIDG